MINSSQHYLSLFSQFLSKLLIFFSSAGECAPSTNRSWLDCTHCCSCLSPPLNLLGYIVFSSPSILIFHLATLLFFSTCLTLIHSLWKKQYFLYSHSHSHCLRLLLPFSPTLIFLYFFLMILTCVGVQATGERVAVGGDDGITRIFSKEGKVVLVNM